ncbi:hypothetical protein H0H81_010565 [Sphagnurus paluster]|uniref:Uncharacterized protein n=1 Tax=Sphagnurus paluster TaxID=117069 RepID=A0A9P7GIZ7_9AGAR|nr:hypothetical protein H0H81_010565 [Sphagnurus paluster]
MKVSSLSNEPAETILADMSLHMHTVNATETQVPKTNNHGHNENPPLWKSTGKETINARQPTLWCNSDLALSNLIRLCTLQIMDIYDFDYCLRDFEFAQLPAGVSAVDYFLGDDRVPLSRDALNLIMYYFISSVPPSRGVRFTTMPKEAIWDSINAAAFGFQEPMKEMYMWVYNERF